MWQHPHYNNVHLDYVRWLRQWTRSFILLDLVLVAGLVVADFSWFTYGLWYLAALANLLFISAVYFELWRRKEHSSGSFVNGENSIIYTHTCLRPGIL